MTALAAVALVVACLVLAHTARQAGYHKGLQVSDRKVYGEGFDVGYSRGRVDADNWWLGIEDAIARERRRMVQ